MHLSRYILRLTSILSLTSHTLAWYDNDACCALAQSENAFRDISSQDAICGQTYTLLANDTPSRPAPDAHVSWSYCHTNCPGWGRSKGDAPGEWAAPIIQFILPSVIFALTIPRTREMDTRSAWIYTKTVKFLASDHGDASMPHVHVGRHQAWNIVRALGHWLLKAVGTDALLILVDTIVWIFVIIFYAGPMLVEGLFEALLDFRILRFVRRYRNGQSTNTKLSQVDLLLTVVIGNLKLNEAHPRDKLLSALPHVAQPRRGHETEDSHIAVKTRLLSMLGTQSIFGATVGAPVLFYLGAFVYSILDLRNNPSNQDSAISLAFGIEWMIVVHVAIVAGCLLANNNPNTTTAIVGLLPSKHNPKVDGNPLKGVEKLIGWSKSYETIFQPVQMWHRGSNKMKWVRESEEWRKCNEGEGIKKSVGLLKWYWLFMPAVLFVLLPSIAGAAVAYATPPVGPGCRSLSFICYAGCQLILVVKAIVELDTEPGSLWPWLKFLAEPWDWLCFEFGRIWGVIAWPYRACPKSGRPVLDFIFVTVPLLLVPIIGSLFTGIGGTLMQVIGVYRTCFCYINAPFWLDLDASPGVNLASDNYGQRISSRNWVWAGATATIFMTIACYLGYAYQESQRYAFIVEVERLFPEDNATAAAAAANAHGAGAGMGNQTGYSQQQQFGNGYDPAVGHHGHNNNGYMNLGDNNYSNVNYNNHDHSNNNYNNDYNNQNGLYWNIKPHRDPVVHFENPDPFGNGNGNGNINSGGLRPHPQNRAYQRPSPFYTSDVYRNDNFDDVELQERDLGDVDQPLPQGQEQYLRRRSLPQHYRSLRGEEIEEDGLLSSSQAR